MSDEVKIGQIVNYTCMESLLRVFGRFLDFTMNFIDYQPVFEYGKQGRLIFTATEPCEPVEALVQWTGIRREIWTGEHRIMTGLRYNDPAARWEPGFIPLDKLTYSDYLAAPKDFSYFDDPLGLDFVEEQAEDAFNYTMENIMALMVYRLYKAGEVRETATGTERQNRALGEKRQSWKELEHLLPYVEYGPELVDLAKQLAAALPE